MTNPNPIITVPDERNGEIIDVTAEVLRVDHIGNMPAAHVRIFDTGEEAHVHGGAVMLHTNPGKWTRLDSMVRLSFAVLKEYPAELVAAHMDVQGWRGYNPEAPVDTMIAAWDEAVVASETGGIIRDHAIAELALDVAQIGSWITA